MTSICRFEKGASAVAWKSLFRDVILDLFAIIQTVDQGLAPTLKVPSFVFSHHSVPLKKSAQAFTLG